LYRARLAALVSPALPCHPPGRIARRSNLSTGQYTPSGHHKNHAPCGSSRSNKKRKEENYHDSGDTDYVGPHWVSFFPILLGLWEYFHLLSSSRRQRHSTRRTEGTLHCRRWGRVGAGQAAGCHLISHHLTLTHLVSSLGPPLLPSRTLRDRHNTVTTVCACGSGVASLHCYDDAHEQRNRQALYCPTNRSHSNPSTAMRGVSVPTSSSPT